MKYVLEIMYSIDQCVPNFFGRVPVFACPVASDQVFERIRGAQLDSNAVGTVARQRLRQVVFVSNGHGSLEKICKGRRRTAFGPRF